MSIPQLTAEYSDRRAYAFQLRRAGHTLREIGEELGVTRERARQLVLSHTAGVNTRNYNARRATSSEAHS